VRATVKDVAARAGVSPKTVSNVINGTSFVREATRQRVEDALAELEYVPNLSARGLRNGRSGVIALALPDLATPYSGEMAHAFVEAAHQRGWAVQIEETASRPEREGELLLRAQANLIDGLILNPITLADSVVARSRSLPPVVLIGEVEQNLVDQVRVDPVRSAYEMTEYLLSLGASTIAVVGSPYLLNTATARFRTVGYRSALTDAGIALDPALEISASVWSPRGGAEAVSAFLERNDLPDAFFCFTDSLAIGTLSTLAAAGIRVPEDVFVAGFDNIAHGEFASPPLTTIDFDKRAFVDAALDRLAERIADRDHAPVLTTIPHRLIRRASTGA